MSMEYKKKRDTTKQDIIYGMRPVMEAIDQKKEINKILVQKGLSGNLFHELRAKLKHTLVPVQLVPVQKLNKLTNQNHQGVVAQVSPLEYANYKELVPKLIEEKQQVKLLVLDQVTDVRNFGSIARSAECTGFDAIIIPAKGGASITSDAVKTSAGALYNIPVSKADNLRDVLEFLSDNDVTIYACSEKTETTITECTFQPVLAVVMGAEGKGISQDLINRSHHVCKIPMFGKTQSFNVAVAAGIIMYEINRSLN